MPPTQTILEEINIVQVKPISHDYSNGHRHNKSKVTLKAAEIIDQEFPTEIVWRNVIYFVYLHAAAIYGFGLFISGQIMWQTVIWGIFLTYATGLSITAGCHRLWTHKSYKAKLPLELLLLTFQTIAFQNSVWEWCRDHRQHHKYSETHGDPHNVNRGFFFAHMGWLLCKKHPAVKEKGKGIDMSDLETPLLNFQRKYYVPLMVFFCFLFPTIVPMFFWADSFTSSWFFASQFRFCFSLHATWSVNSAAHLWGSKPYNKNINPAENKFVSFFALGEGWHNYHHTFPWDYKTAELGDYQLNLTTGFIDAMSLIGLAYDLKTVNKNAVLQRVERTGDGSHPHHLHGGGPWGWGDKDIPESDLQITEIIN